MSTIKVTGVVFAIVLVALGVTGGWLEADKSDYKKSHAYPLLDPSVSDPDVHQEIINFDPLRQSLKQYLASIKLDHSLYFEYLPNGANIRDGADTASIAASLMKLPVVMDLYKLSETGQLNIDSKATVQKSDLNSDSDYGDPTNLKAGDRLSLRQAAQITLNDSDNTTLNVIKDKILPRLNSSTDSIQSLDISYSLSGTTPGNEQVSISSRSYGSVMKCIYYACFNTPQDSEQMINYLTGSVEQNRLMAGVGGGINVAHKVGSSPTSQSDCGIVYYPQKPYLVCLMFLNLTPTTSANIDPYFQNVSQMIYDYVAKS